jgi:membrane-bound hydrogenase subunit beta
MPEQNIQLELARKFDFLRDKIRIQRVRRMYVHVPVEKFPEVFDYVVKNMKFCVLSAMTGLDEGATLGLIYHLGRENGIMLNLSTSVPKEKPVLKTITSYFPAADVYEREVIDLLGFQIEGLPQGSRYPLTDDWPAGQYPLRKDWKGETLAPKEVSENAKNA